jgi:Domain of unknown function (DUF4167)
LINNRQPGRRRGRGNQRPQSSNSGGPRGGQDNGNRIDNRARGNAAQLLEKYKTLARDAQQSGDRVLTEYYLQFADHYFRVLADTRARYEENNPRRDTQQRYEGEDSGFEGEEGFEGDEGDEFDPRPQPRRETQPPRYERDGNVRDGNVRDSNGRDGNVRNDERPRRDREEARDRPQQSHRATGNGYVRDGGENSPREDRNRDERPRDERPRGEQSRSEPAADERSLDDQPRSERPRREYRAREQRPAREEEASTLDAAILPPAITLPPAPEPGTGEVAPAPKRRGRPRKVVVETPSELS